MHTEDIASAVNCRPPEEGNGTDLSLTGTTASAATPTGVSANRGKYRFAVASAGAFNIRFSSDGTNTVTDPGDRQTFPAGVYVFTLNEKNTHFKITAHTTGYVTYWKASRNY